MLHAIKLSGGWWEGSSRFSPSVKNHMRRLSDIWMNEATSYHAKYTDQSLALKITSIRLMLTQINWIHIYYWGHHPTVVECWRSVLSGGAGALRHSPTPAQPVTLLPSQSGGVTALTLVSLSARAVRGLASEWWEEAGKGYGSNAVS